MHLVFHWEPFSISIRTSSRPALGNTCQNLPASVIQGPLPLNWDGNVELSASSQVPSGPLGVDGFGEGSHVSTVSLFPWGEFSSLPLSDLPSCLSYANCAGLFSAPFIHSEMPFYFLHCSHPSPIPRGGLGEKQRPPRDISAILGRDAPAKRTLFSIKEKMGHTFLFSFPGTKYLGKV